MKALLTGSTGFLGGYILGHFKEIGLDTVTVGRSEGNDVQCDLSVGVPLLNEQEQLDFREVYNKITDFIRNSNLPS